MPDWSFPEVLIAGGLIIALLSLIGAKGTVFNIQIDFTPLSNRVGGFAVGALCLAVGLVFHLQVWESDEDGQQAAGTPTPTSEATVSASPSPTPTLTVTPSPTPRPGGNLIDNPGFEAGLIGWHATSQQTAADSGSYTADSVERHAGAQSVRGSESSRSNLGRLYQDVTARATAGRTYKISGWIKSENVQGSAVICLCYANSSGATPSEGTVSEIGNLSGTHDWTYFESIPFVLPPPGAAATNLWLVFDFNDGTGTAWWDDVSLVEVGQ